jgi:hypothetical protein
MAPGGCAPVSPIIERQHCLRNCDSEIQAASAIALIFERTISELTEAIEKPRSSQRVFRFAFV